MFDGIRDETVALIYMLHLLIGTPFSLVFKKGSSLNLPEAS